MKKILLLIISFLLILITSKYTFATDACDLLIERNANFIGEITGSVNIRSYPCTYKSEIIGSGKVGENYNVVAQVDGYYKINLGNGIYGRIWDQKIKNSGKELKKEHKLTSKEILNINKILNFISKKVHSGDKSYKEKIIKKLDFLLSKFEKGSRNYKIIEEILIKVKQINLNNIL